MLHHSFTHMPSIGAKTERKIWDTGVCSMDDFIHNPPVFFSKKKVATMIEQIHLSKENISDNNVGFFYHHFPAKEQWRIFKEFQGNTAYLDIETTGLDAFSGMITTIALYDGQKIKYYINGENLKDFKSDIMQYDVIVTYNGKTFDIPFIESYFNIHLSHCHLDLRYILKDLGFSGGLKSCERSLGIGRSGDLADIDGYFAVLLWNDYKRKRNVKSLETLLSYNIEDVLNLEYLMIESYNRKIKDIPFSVDKIKVPQTPDNPFAVDSATVRRIQSRYYG